MKDQTKLQLSPFEMELVTGTGWILTKNGIIQKAKKLLEQLQAEQQTILLSSGSVLPEEVLQIPAKISKGENYKGLPYLILDQPRYFSQQNIFAIRTLFWWGNFFSSTLHLSGHYKRLYENKILPAYETWKQQGFFICIHPDPWEHHFEEDNFIPVSQLNPGQFEPAIRNSSFIKLAKKIPLQEWDGAIQTMTDIFRQYLVVLTI